MLQDYHPELPQYDADVRCGHTLELLDSINRQAVDAVCLEAWSLPERPKHDLDTLFYFLCTKYLEWCVFDDRKALVTRAYPKYVLEFMSRQGHTSYALFKMLFLSKKNG